MEESIKRLRSFDFFMGLGFLAVGLFVMYDGYVAWTAPALSVVPKPSNPGITTLFVGGSLVFLGLVIAVIGLRGSGNPLRIGKQAVSETIRSKPFRRDDVHLQGRRVVEDLHHFRRHRGDRLVHFRRARHDPAALRRKRSSWVLNRS
jgi:hypothetical protein